jgi:hypothetical protein
LLSHTAGTFTERHSPPTVQSRHAAAPWVKARHAKLISHTLYAKIARVKLLFVYLSPLVSDARRLGFVDEDLQELESMLLDRPDAGSTVAGTGGVPKIRFSPSRWRRGKSGATRVIYAYMPTAERAYVTGIKKYLDSGI